MNAQNSIITIISALVATMTPVVTITANVASGDNWKLSMCNTFWLNTGTTITIGAVNFTVESFVKNEYIIVSGSAQPIGTSFQLSAPEFVYGNRRKVNNERNIDANLANAFVYLPPLETDHPNDQDSDIAYTAPIRPLFLVQFDEQKDEIDLQQTEVIEPMNAMADYFIKLINDDIATFEEPNSFKKKDWMNFGNPTIWGNNELIFDQPLSGVELKIDLEVMPHNLCLCDGAPVVNCLPVNVIINGVQFSVVNSGDNATVNVRDTLGALVGSIVGGEWVVPAAGGDPVTSSMNGASLTDTPAGEDKAFTIEYADGSPVVVTSVTDTANVFEGTIPNCPVPVVPLNTANQVKTGDTNDGDRGRSRTVLSGNNPFGNTNAQTDTLGGQSYTNDVVIDWNQADQVGETVLGIYRIPPSGMDLTDHENNALAVTIDGYNDWRLINRNEICTLLNSGPATSTNDYLNYSPYNIVTTSQGDRIFTETRGDIASRVIMLVENGALQNLNKTSIARTILVRLYTYAELGV